MQKAKEKMRKEENMGVKDVRRRKEKNTEPAYRAPLCNFNV